MMWLLVATAAAGGRGAEPPAPDLADPATRARIQMEVLAGLVESGMTDQALEIAAKLRADGNTGVRLDLLEAESLHAKGLNTEAVALLERTVKGHPRESEAWARLGLLYADLKRLPEATTALERAARLARNDADVLNNLGFVEYAQGRYQDAAGHYRAALMLDPSDQRIRNNLGFALAALEQDSEAFEAFRAGGDEADARYNLGYACELRADRAGALTHYQAALLARPDHPQATTALNALLAAESP